MMLKLPFPKRIVLHCTAYSSLMVQLGTYNKLRVAYYDAFRILLRHQGGLVSVNCLSTVVFQL